MQTKRYLKSNIASILLSVCGAAAVLNIGVPISANSLSDSQILGLYIQVNSFDIETSLLGQAQGKSESVRKLAGHVASDHMGVRQAAYALAGKCKVSIALPAGRDLAAVEHSKAMIHLLSLSGEQFDKAYSQQESAFHRAAIRDVRTTLLPAAVCPALKAHFNDVLPAFEHHLAQAEDLEHELSIR